MFMQQYCLIMSYAYMMCSARGLCFFFPVEAPILTVVSTTYTTISLFWTSAGSVVDSYEVMWKRDTSKECPDEDEGSITIINGPTSHTLIELEEGSTYTLTVTASNIFGSAVSNFVSGVTEDVGKLIELHIYSQTSVLCQQIL